MFDGFRLKLGPDVVINNYWRIKFFLSKAMCERESFGDMVKLTINLFKEDVENNLRHMQDIIHLSEPPFHHPQGRKIANRSSKKGETSKVKDDKADYAFTG